MNTSLNDMLINRSSSICLEIIKLFVRIYLYPYIRRVHDSNIRERMEGKNLDSNVTFSSLNLETFIVAVFAFQVGIMSEGIGIIFV
jgi:hypothetical protein